MPANKAAAEKLVTVYEQVVPQLTEILQIRGRRKRAIFEEIKKKKAHALKIRLFCMMLVMCVCIILGVWYQVNQTEKTIVVKYEAVLSYKITATCALDDLAGAGYQRWQMFLSAEAREKLNVLLSEADYEALVKEIESALSRKDMVSTLHALVRATQLYPERAYLQYLKHELSEQISSVAELYENGEDFSVIECLDPLLSDYFYYDQEQINFDPEDYIENLSGLKTVLNMAQHSFQECIEIYDVLIASDIVISEPEEIIPDRRRVHCYVTTGNNLRSGPGPKYSEIKWISPAECPLLIAIDKDRGWALLFYDGCYGWLALKHLQILNW